MKIVKNGLIIILLIGFPLAITELLKTEPAYYQNVVLTLSIYYALIFYFILKRLVFKNRLLLFMNLVPLVGLEIGLVFHRIYKVNCNFEIAITQNPEVCEFVFRAENWIYPAIYLGIVILIIDFALIVKRLFFNNPSSSSFERRGNEDD